MAPLRRAATPLLAGLLLAWCAVVPYRLTDGDSCLYAAVGHEMAAGGRWLAPRWAFQGEPACFHENPPAAAWPAAALEAAGLPDGQAPLVANALWLLLLLLALARLPRGLPAGTAWLAPLLLLLLHEPLWRYALRFGLEIPFAACAVAALAAARSPARLAPPLAGLALAGAFLVRGVFGLPVLALLLLDARLGRESASGWRRRGGAILLALLLLVGFDLGHRAGTGHSFWWAHLQRQVLPSLAEGGTIHPNRGSTLLYYGGRLALYALPAWLLLAAAARRRQLLRPEGRRDQLLAIVWILLFFTGVALARRQGSRYLFAVWPATALLASHALAGLGRGRLQRAGPWLAPAALALALALTGGKSLLTPRDTWWRSADLLRQERSLLDGPVYGPFRPQDDRLKQFLRHHGGTWAFAAPPARPGRGDLRWLPAGQPPAPGERPLLLTPLGSLVR